ASAAEPGRGFPAGGTHGQMDLPTVAAGPPRRTNARGGAGMLKAWVLIQTEVGRAGEVAAAVTAIDGVELSDVTARPFGGLPRRHGADLSEVPAGPFDVIAKVQAPNLDALRRLIVSRVQAVPGTLRTLTCPRPAPAPPGAWGAGRGPAGAAAAPGRGAAGRAARDLAGRGRRRVPDRLAVPLRRGGALLGRRQAVPGLCPAE